MQILKVTSEDALLRRQQECLDISQVLNFSGASLQIHQVGEDPADLSQSQLCCHLLHVNVLWIFEQLNRILCAFLRRLVDRRDTSSNTQRNIGRYFISTIEKSHSLIPSDSPIVEELVNDVIVLEENVVNVTIRLRVQRDS